MTDPPISSRAAAGFYNSAAYDTHRPTYAAAVVDELLTHLGVAGVAGARIIDLAAGTGKFTAAVAARPEGFEVIAVEPHAEMRRVLADKHFPNVAVLGGAAEEMVGVETDWADAVVAAQAFHWFATPTALREIHRVLRPHGSLGLIWNAEDYNSPRAHTATTSWLAALHDLNYEIADASGDTEPRFRHLKWREIFDHPPDAAGRDGDVGHLFRLPIQEHSSRFSHQLTIEGLWDRFATLGHVAVLQGAEKERVRQTFLEIVSSPEVEKNKKGELTVHGDTYTYWTAKISG